MEHHQYLIGDIGGTNTTLAFARQTTSQKKTQTYTIYKKKTYPSATITDLPATLATFIGKTAIRAICLAAAGKHANNHINPTNLRWTIDRTAIQKKTRIKKVYLINDFEAIGHSLTHMRKNQYITLTRHKHTLDKTIAIIGAGTGLGTSVRLPDNTILPSEAGHVDIPIHTAEDLAIVNFIQKKLKTTLPLDSEELISGRGIAHIFDYHYQTKHARRKTGKDNISGQDRQQRSREHGIYTLSQHRKTAAIAQYASTIPLCATTMRTFIRFYARYAKNCALQTLSTGGVVLAGGIAMKNPRWFGKEFLAEFRKHRMYARTLSAMPIIMITDYGISLDGAMRVVLEKS